MGAYDPVPDRAKFKDLISFNFSQCPTCDKPMPDDSPVSMIDNKTKICPECSTKESLWDVGWGIKPHLDDSGDLEKLVSSLGPAKAQERVQKESRHEFAMHEDRLNNSKFPIPEPTKVGIWDVEYERNRFTGEIEASTYTPTSNNHDAILNGETGKVSFGLRGTAIPPKHVQAHIRRVLTNHFKKHSQQ